MVGCLVGSLVVRKDDHHEYTPALTVGVGVVNVYSLLLYTVLCNYLYLNRELLIYHN